MSASPKALLLARLHGITKTLERTPPSEKKNPIALQLAFDFNGILKVVGEQFPALVGSLPSDMNTRGPLSSVGRSSATYLDIEIACEQVLTLLDLMED